jgi:hypothetical protein
VYFALPHRVCNWLIKQIKINGGNKKEKQRIKRSEKCVVNRKEGG